MSKSIRKQQILADKRNKKASHHASGESKYAKKAKFLAKVNEFGFNFGFPKPWSKN